MDNIDGSVAVTSSGSVNTNIIGTYIITYTANDTAGNIATATRAVKVIAKPPTGGGVLLPPATTPTSTATTTASTSTVDTESGQVLGIKIYGDGVLLRGPDFKIYALKNGGRYYVSNLAELWNYRGWKLYNVSFEEIAAFEDYTGRIYAAGVLLRAKNFKIYAIKAGLKKHHVLNLIELKDYRDWRLYYNVSDAIINLYPSI
jgi:hypothetical protein